MIRCESPLSLIRKDKPLNRLMTASRKTIRSRLLNMAHPQTLFGFSKDRRSWLFKSLLISQTLFMVGLGLWLAQWQLQRADAKQQLLEQFQTAQSKSVEESLNRFDRVRLAGAVFTQRYFLIDNRTWQGKAGYELVVVMQRASRNYLVSLGWLAAGPYRDQIPQLQLPAYLDIKDARVDRVSEQFQLGVDTWSDSWPKRVQQLDIDAASQALGQRLETWLIRAVDTQVSGIQPIWQPVVVPVERHWGYSVQWFALAVTWLVCSVLLYRKLFTNCVINREKHHE